jgi:hypothetical protein
VLKPGPGLCQLPGQAQKPPLTQDGGLPVGGIHAGSLQDTATLLFILLFLPELHDLENKSKISFFYVNLVLRFLKNAEDSASKDICVKHLTHGDFVSYAKIL